MKYKNNLNGVNDNSLIVKSVDLNVDNNASEIYSDITFKVQIAASTRKLETKSYNFKGLNDISIELKNGIYKYYYGATSNYSAIKAQKTEAIKKGYNSSFVIAIKNGEQIPLTDALKTSSN